MPAGNAYSIDKHPKKKAIIKDLLRGQTDNAIANNYGLPVSCVRRYRNGKMMALISSIWDEEKVEASLTIEQRIEDIASRMRKMLQACDEWLQDPDDPDHYNMSPRAEEVDIIYTTEETDDKGKVFRKKTKARLSDILARMEDKEMSPCGVFFHTVDTRKIMIETSRELASELRILAELQGQVRDIRIAENKPTIILNQVGGVILKNVSEEEMREAIISELKDLRSREGVEEQ